MKKTSFKKCRNGKVIAVVKENNKVISKKVIKEPSKSYRFCYEDDPVLGKETLKLLFKNNPDVYKEFFDVYAENGADLLRWVSACKFSKEEIIEVLNKAGVTSDYKGICKLFNKKSATKVASFLKKYKWKYTAKNEMFRKVIDAFIHSLVLQTTFGFNIGFNKGNLKMAKENIALSGMWPKMEDGESEDITLREFEKNRKLSPETAVKLNGEYINVKDKSNIIKNLEKIADFCAKNGISEEEVLNALERGGFKISIKKEHTGVRLGEHSHPDFFRS
jgi:predicted Zn-ribbon and HTH transcriptional regulator